MSRDYKHSARKPRKPPPTPAWVWMASGFIGGLGVALGVHLYHLSAPADTAPTPRSAAVPASETADDELAMRATGDDADVEEEYSFYERLKQTVVRVPDEKTDSKPVRPPPTGVPSKLTPGPSETIRMAGDRGSTDSVSPRSPPTPDAATPPGGYLVQTGSFRDSAQAEAMRASLGLLGLASSIQQAVDGDNRTWHRVQVPAPDESELARVRSLLEREDIDVMIIAQRN